MGNYGKNGRRTADIVRKATSNKIAYDTWRQGQQIRSKSVGPKSIFQGLYTNRKDTAAVVNYIIKNIGKDGEYIYTPSVVEKWIQEIDPEFKMPELPEPTSKNKCQDKKQGNDR